MMTTASEACARENCNCMALDDSKFCSPQCDTAPNGSQSRCKCGHEGCSGDDGLAAGLPRIA